MQYPLKGIFFFDDLTAGIFFFNVPLNASFSPFKKSQGYEIPSGAFLHQPYDFSVFYGYGAEFKFIFHGPRNLGHNFIRVSGPPLIYNDLLQKIVIR